MKQRISVIIPTIYAADPVMLLESVRAVREAARNTVSLSVVICVNQAPTDQASVRFLRERLLSSGRNVRVLISHINKGFAPAVNDGIVFSRGLFRPDWYMVLNDDAYVHKNFFTALLPALEKQTADAVSCGIRKPDGSIEGFGLRYYRTGLAFPGLKVVNGGDVMFSGACVLLQPKRIEAELARHGFVFQPLFFAYAEDVELSMRIQKDGGSVYIHPEVLVTHAGSKTAKRGSFFQLYYGYRNLILVVLLHWKPAEILARLPYLLTGQLYIFAMSVYKRHVLLYPKIWWWIIKNGRIIMWQRNRYDTQ